MSPLMQACSPTTTDELVDIREVAVDKALPKRNGLQHFSTNQKSISFPLRRFCGKRCFCQQRSHIGGMPARDFKVIDILAFFQMPCYDGLGKG